MANIRVVFPKGDVWGDLLEICKRIASNAQRPDEFSGRRLISADDLELLQDVVDFLTLKA